MELQVTDDVLTIVVDGDLYSEEVLFKCFYWYTNTFEVNIARSGLNGYKVVLKSKEPKTIGDWNSVIFGIKRDLVDYKLRQIVTNETRTIRELIIAKAFAYYDQEESPQSQVTDPVGFNPQTV